MDGLQWYKSTYSGGNPDDICVEVADTPTGRAVRDSKNPAGGMLAFDTGVFGAFIQAVKTDAFAV